MKKFFTFAILALTSLAASQTAQAQTGNNNDTYHVKQWNQKKHQLSVNYGVATLYDFAEVMGDIFVGAFDHMLGDKDDLELSDMSGGFTIGYRYNLNDRWAIGLDGSYEKMTMSGKHNAGNSLTRNYYSIMPTARVYWFNKSHVSMYSRAAAGVVIFTSKSNKDNKTESNATFTGQLSPIGIEVGGQVLRGFGEFGFGAEGLLQVGARCSF